MRPRHLLELLALAAVWGASFLFMRVAAPEFGAAPMAAVRVAGASLVLLPLLALRHDMPALRRHWRSIGLVGLSNSALPFLCYGVAAQSITAGLASIFNAATPLFTALIAWLWLREALTRWRVLGLLIGLAGVLGLAWDKAGLKAGAGQQGVALAVAACLAATVMYGFSACFTRRHLQGVPPMALAAGSQLSAALALAMPALWWWPAQMPGLRAWAMVLALAVLCTGVAYVLYFRLLAHVGATNASSVTFLIPVFAMAWGGLLLGETVTPAMLLGGAVILGGTALAMGLWPRPHTHSPATPAAAVNPSPAAPVPPPGPAGSR
ncbi:DMT(drug/metabolite transporter) superfamily permease [Burkholderiales bacterium JOSHI_001]|nr:DMT(drug/metabolite transporter) superfamily permease [Burkholderiales bacterium JOSHI_001]